jgi:hypothetical protein
VTTRRQSRLLLTLSIVLGAHLVLVWLLASSHQLSVRIKSGSLELVWIARPPLLQSASERGTTEKPRFTPPPHRVDRTPASPLMASPPIEENNAIHSGPDWTEELHRAAKETLAKELARKRHELDFAHAFPTQPKKTQEFAWDYAATHRVETIPEGGMLIHLSDNCVLVLMPLPIVGCGIGKRPANGDLFEHRRDQ